MQLDASPSNCWNLGFCSAMTPNDAEDDSNNDDSVANNERQITLETPSATIGDNSNMATNPATTMATSSSPTVLVGMLDFPKDRRKKRNLPDDCHISFGGKQVGQSIGQQG
jgi:hypothetical protein